MNHNVYIAGRHPLVEFPNLNWIPWSLGQKLDNTNLPRLDLVVHLAWQTKSRRENFHLNIGGSLQLISQASMSGSRVIFVSSLAALNPRSYYGIAKSIVEKKGSFKEFEIIRPGLILHAEEYSKKIKKFAIIPGHKTPVYVTHLECLLSELLMRISQTRESDRNVVCKVMTLSELIGKKRPYISFPAGVGKVLLKATSRSKKLGDVRDSYISLITTPNLKPNSCKVRSQI